MKHQPPIVRAYSYSLKVLKDKSSELSGEYFRVQSITNHFQACPDSYATLDKIKSLLLDLQDGIETLENQRL